MEKTWWKEAIAYQIYVRSFYDSNNDGIGDLEGIIEKIPYLKSLGINLVYLNPINKSPNDDNGYDVSDFYDIMDEFGSLSTFKLLLKKLHENGIKLILDLVLNHSSDEHAWFKEAKKDKKNKYHDYYIFKDNNGKLPNNWQSFFGGSSWEENKATKEYYLHIFSKKQPDFNYKNESLRLEIANIVKFWKDLGVDGFRFDAINHIAKDNDFRDGDFDENGNLKLLERIQNLEECHYYIRELRERVFTKDDYYKYVLIGEAGGISYKNAYKYTKRENFELDMLFHFDFHSIGRGKYDYLREKIDLINSIKNPILGWVNRDDSLGWQPIFYSNHDTTRTVSRLGCENDTNSYREKSAKMLCLMQFTQKGTPFIYYGDEIGMTNANNFEISDFKDIAVKNAYKNVDKNDKKELDNFLKGLKLTNRDNSRTPMQWSQNLNAGFSKSEPWIKLNDNYKIINVEQELLDENSILNFYKKMILLRKNNPILIYGDTISINHENPNIFSYIRKLKCKEILVVINFFKDEVILSDKILKEIKNRKLLLSNYTDSSTHLLNSKKLRAFESLIFS